MIQDAFEMDGVYFDVNVLSLSRKFNVTDTDTSGRTQDGGMHRDIIGTYFNYTMEIGIAGENYQAYNDFYEAISSPTESHRMVFPYGGETLTFKAYITEGEDKLKIINGNHRWSGLKVSFIAMQPQRR